MQNEISEMWYPNSKPKSRFLKTEFPIIVFPLAQIAGTTMHFQANNRAIRRRLGSRNCGSIIARHVVIYGVRGPCVLC
jgi:hypothetical protein